MEDSIGTKFHCPYALANDNKQFVFSAWTLLVGQQEGHTHTHTTILRPSWILSRTTQVRQHQKGKIRKVKPIWIYRSNR